MKYYFKDKNYSALSNFEYNWGKKTIVINNRTCLNFVSFSYGVFKYKFIV